MAARLHYQRTADARVFADATNAVVRVLLAPLCAACGAALVRPLESPVCASCWLSVPRLAPPCCVRCGDALPSWRAAGPFCARCRRRPPQFVMARSAGLYGGSLREIIHAFKYERRRLLAEPLGQLLREAGHDVLAGADAVVPVPLHPIRAWQRGFNQADDLACQLGLPVWRALHRRRHGPPQAGLPAARRHANVRAAYAPSWRVRLRHPRPLHHSIVVLIDDVMTTGATVEACSRVLLETGVRSVRVLTVARAVAGPRSPPPGRPDLSIVPRR
jgi:ComF family protein